jgi:hypothetical protein
MAVFIGAVKKTSNTDYTLYLGEIKSKKGNIWKVYQKDITQRKGAYMKFDWRIVRAKDGLVLSTAGLPKDVSLGDFIANKKTIKSKIDQIES